MEYLFQAQTSQFSMGTHRVDFINEHAEICGLWIIAAQVRMASFHTIIISFFYLLRRGIWKLVIDHPIIRHTQL